MTALPRAFFSHTSRAFSSGSPKPWTAKSTIVVVPPNAAAVVPVSKSSDAIVPPNGSSMWVWTSMPPGIRYLRLASIRFAPAALSPVPIAATFSPSVSTSALYVSAAGTPDARANVVGSFGAGRSHTVPENAHVLWCELRVHPAQRRKGLGTALFRDFVQACDGQHPELLFMGMTNDRVAAGEGFLKRLG